MRKLTSTNLRNERLLTIHCPFAYTLSIIGKRWRAAVLWKVLRGEANRYGTLRRAIPGISPKMLAQELRALEEYGVLERSPESLVGELFHYQVTPLGKSLEPALKVMWAWGENQRPVRLVEG